jgi:molybdopterin/thiamine biosynthesis adenylyltransferase
MTSSFDPREAFERNFGLITRAEQDRLFSARVTIAGCGGVGGLHAHVLARLGIGRFRLADFDTFSVVNFNRQIGATVETVGKSKAKVTAAMIRSIDPTATIEILEEGVTAANADAFVAGADLVVDGVDFFALDGRRALFAAARRAGVPAITAGPLGFGATLHVFSPTGMSFDEYFDLADRQDPFEQLLNFVVGLAPGGLHVPYLDFATVNPATGRGPSSIVGTQLASCLVGAEAVRILLGRGPSPEAPRYFQFDAYRRKLKSGSLPRGNRSVVQRLKRAVLRKRARALGWDRALLERAKVQEGAP